MAENLLAKEFENFKAGEDFIKQFFDDNYHPVKATGRMSVDQFNNKIRGDAKKIRTTELPGDAVYSVRYVCKHFGQFKARTADVATLTSRNRQHYSRGCQFYVYLSWDRTGHKYVIKSCQLTHSHDIGPDLYRLYADKRKPDEVTRNQAVDMLAVGAKPTLVSELLQRQNVPVTTKDIHNLRQKLKFRGSAEDELVDVIRRNELTHKLHTTECGELACITWASTEQLALLASHGEVVMLDATYKINNLRMPLFTLAVVDRDGHGQPVAHSLMAREDERHISMFLGDVAEWHPGLLTATFITDKDFAEINAVKSLSSSINIFLCRFHIMKAFVEEINRQSVSDGETLLTHLRKLLYSASNEKYNSTLDTVRTAFPRFYTYLQDNWLPHASLFAGFSRNGILHFDTHTNNKLERFHHTIKSVIGSSQVSVAVLVDRLCKLLRVRSATSRQAIFDQHMKKRNLTNPVLSAYGTLVSAFALQRISEEHSRSQRMRNSGKHTATHSTCTCAAHISFFLPCRHIFYVRRNDGASEYDEELVASRWKYSDVLPRTTNVCVGPPVSSGIQVVTSDIRIPSATAGQRFRSAMTVFTPMASLMAEMSQTRFSACMQWFREIEDKLRDGTWSSSAEQTQTPPESADGPDDNTVEPDTVCINPTQSATPSVHPDRVVTASVTDSSEQIAAEATLIQWLDDNAAEPDTVEVVPSHTASSTASSSPSTQQTDEQCFKFPKKVAQRGRPATVRQRRFVLKRKAAPQTAREPADASAEDNCAE